MTVCETGQRSNQHRLSFHSQRFPVTSRQTESSPSGMKRLFPRHKLEVVEKMVDEIGFEGQTHRMANDVGNPI
jgi:hypothetical protein